MEQNSKMIAGLNHKLRRSSNKNAELKKMIVILNEQLEQKNMELTALNQKLTELNIQIVQLQTSMEKLTLENTSKSQTIAEETAALHTAYYLIGKSKDLQESKIIDRKGGLLGIGRTSKLNSNLDKSKFIVIDYTQVGKIAINHDGVKIVTSHPSDSYTLEKDTKDKDLIKNLIITNPEKFWSESKYLVIVKG
jgi:TolA-binding protein